MASFSTESVIGAAGNFLRPAGSFWGLTDTRECGRQGPAIEVNPMSTGQSLERLRGMLVLLRGEVWKLSKH